MALCYRMALLLAYLLKKGSSETLSNPKEDTIYHCGLVDDCIIKCDEFYSCLKTTFYLYNNRAVIECSGDHSCGGLSTTIISKNATSLNLTVTGKNSLWIGEVVVDHPDTTVYVNCDGYQACRWASFYYRTEKTVTHICAGGSGCVRGMIHATTSIELHCHNEQLACNYLDVIWPTNPEYIRNSKMINYVDTKGITRAPRFLYLANTEVIPNITCVDGCNTYDIFMIYGSTFDQTCSFNDSSCIPTILAYEDTYNASLFNSDFYPSDRDGEYTFTQNTLLSIHRSDRSWLMGSMDVVYANLSKLNVDFISTNDAFITVLCTQCTEVALNFSAISNTVLTVTATAKFVIIDGPKTSITTNIIPDSSASVLTARFLLQNTESVTFNGLPEMWHSNECDDNTLLCTSDIYLGTQTDVTIQGFLKRSGDCCDDDEKVNIISPLGSVTNVINHGWNIDCGADIDRCVFFKYYPTLSPTLSPTIPTINPTQFPTLPPTVATINPTKFPSLSPTVSTVDPTAAPSIPPTVFPSGSPSSPPTLAPSSAPTEPPTKAPWTDREVVDMITTTYGIKKRRVIVTKNGDTLHIVIWILGVALGVSIVALVIYVFKTRCCGKKHRSITLDLDEVECVQPGSHTTGGETFTDGAPDAPEIGHVPSLPAEKVGRQSNEQQIMLEDDSSDESVNDLFDHQNVNETTKGNAIDVLSNAKESTTGGQ